jgi:hypothetical protein
MAHDVADLLERDAVAAHDRHSRVTAFVGVPVADAGPLGHLAEPPVERVAGVHAPAFVAEDQVAVPPRGARGQPFGRLALLMGLERGDGALREHERALRLRGLDVAGSPWSAGRSGTFSSAGATVTWIWPPARGRVRCGRSPLAGLTRSGTPGSSSAPWAFARAVWFARSRYTGASSTGRDLASRRGWRTGGRWRRAWPAGTSRSTPSRRGCPRWRSSTRSAACVTWGPGCCGRQDRRRTRSATTRCGCSARPGSSRSWASPWSPRCWPR